MNLRIIAKIAIIMSVSQANAEYQMETFSLNYQSIPQYNLNAEYKPETTMNFSDNEMKYKRDSFSIEEKTQMKEARKRKENNDFLKTVNSKYDSMNQDFRKKEMKKKNAKKEEMRNLSEEKRKAYKKKMKAKMSKNRINKARMLKKRNNNKNRR